MQHHQQYPNMFQHVQYAQLTNQYAVPAPPRPQVQYSTQGPSIYPQLTGQIYPATAPYYRAQGCLQDPAGRWWKLLSACRQRIQKIVPLRYLPNGQVVAIADGNVVWSDAPTPYPGAPQTATPAQPLNHDMYNATQQVAPDQASIANLGPPQTTISGISTIYKDDAEPQVSISPSCKSQDIWEHPLSSPDEEANTITANTTSPKVSTNTSPSTNQQRATPDTPFADLEAEFADVLSKSSCKSTYPGALPILSGQRS